MKNRSGKVKTKGIFLFAIADLIRNPVFAGWAVSMLFELQDGTLGPPILHLTSKRRQI
jgi:hypothetical protein